MADKTESQVLAQLQDYVGLLLVVRDFLEGPFELALENIADELAVADEQAETAIQSQALAQVRQQGAALFNQVLSFCQTLHPTLGRLAGAPNPLGVGAANIAKLNDYLVGATKHVKSRGLTFAAWTAGGSNVGTGSVIRLVTDLNGEQMDCAHPDAALRLRCIQSAGPGVSEGQEPFDLIGSAIGWPWEDANLGGAGRGYTPSWGYGIKEFSGQQGQINSSENAVVIRAMSGGSNNNLIQNGNCEAAALAASGNDKFSGVTFVSGATNVALNETSPIHGDQDFKITGNCKFYFPLRARAIRPKTAIAFGAILKRIEGDDMDLDITLKIIDDSSTHKTITLDETGLTANAIDANYDAVVLPANIGENLRLEIEVTNFTASTPATDYLLIDEFIVGQMFALDGGQCILPVAGVTPFKQDDLFTSSVTSTDAGLLQYFFNRVFGRYLTHEGTAGTWTDPVYEPDISLVSDITDPLADGGTDARGSEAAGATSADYTITNNGLVPLCLGYMTIANESNVDAIADVSQAVLVMPGDTYDFTINYTISGAGAYSFTVSIATNDASQNPLNWTVSGVGS